MTTIKFFLLMMMLFLTGMIRTQAAEIISAPITDTEPVCDGSISEGEWRKAFVFTKFYQIAPGYNAEPSEKTVIYMMHDEKAIYVAAQCYVENKSTIQDFRCQRDNISGTDRVYLYFDTFNQMDNGYYFGTNINGEQADGIVNGNGSDASVNMPFKSAAVKTDYGYSVEFTIPLKSLAYKAGEKAQWGVFMKRIIAGKDEESAIAPINRAALNYFENYVTTEFEKLPFSQNLTVLTSVISNSSITEDRLSEISEHETTVSPELTVTYEPFSGATFTTTINPDFSTVEADSVTVTANARYPVFYSERRPFFIEKLNPFNSQFTLFHTRQIVNPVWGSKVSLRSGNVSFFALAAQDQDTPADRFSVSGEDGDAYFAFSHVGYQIGTNGSLVRAAFAGRSFNGYDNLLGSIDTTLTLNESFKFLGQFVKSSVELDDTTTRYGEGYYFNTSYDNINWHVEIATRGISKYLRDDLGYITDTDFQKYAIYAKYETRAQTDKETVRFWQTDINVQAKYNYGSDRLIGWHINPSGGINFSNDISIWAGHEEYMENYGGRDNMTQFWWANVNIWTSDLIGGELTCVTGTGLWYDEATPFTADYWRNNVYVDAKVFRWMQMSVSGSYEKLDGAYHATTYEVRTKLQFHKNFIFRTIAQYCDTTIDLYDLREKTLNLYPLFIYQPNVHFSVYAGMTYTGDDLRIGTPLADDRSQVWFVKISASTDIL